MVLEAMRESLLGLPCISDTYSCCSGLLNLLQPACLHSSAEHPSATDLLHHAVQSNSNSCMHVNCAVVFAVGQKEQGISALMCCSAHHLILLRQLQMQHLHFMYGTAQLPNPSRLQWT